MNSLKKPLRKVDRTVSDLRSDQFDVVRYGCPKPPPTSDQPSPTSLEPTCIKHLTFSSVRTVPQKTSIVINVRNTEAEGSKSRERNRIPS
ncbi:hypothetical protein J6590_059667 [Homalodisca vitripennis]|nr:hypothetical protein J6590_059667 [Homalodisca vitripennis]